MGAFESCPFTCIKNWNPTTTRAIGTSALTTAQQTTCSCAIGTYDVNYVCTLCDVGYYCTGGTRYACSTGLTTSSTGASSSNDCGCAVGYYMGSSTCTACSTGYSTTTTGSTSSSDCSICAVGYYMSGSTCTACSTGYTTSTTGASSSSDCSICAVGYYMSGSSCTVCSTGYTTASTGATSSSACSICAGGYTMTDGYCAYICSSEGAIGCCQPRVAIANNVTSIGNTIIKNTCSLI